MVSDFDKYKNISYIDETLPPPDKRLIYKHCFCSYIIYSCIFILLFFNPFFREYFNYFMMCAYIIGLILYIIFAPVVYLIFKPKSIYKSHSIEICNYFKNIFKKIFNKNTLLANDYLSVINGFIPTYEQKQALMLMFIKVFFGTLMVRFLYNDIISINAYINDFSKLLSSNKSIFDFIIQNGNFLYSFALTLLFTVDVGVFAFGYLSEASFLNNKVRTVETSFAGIFFCLICYPSFNFATGKIIGWNQDDNAILFGDYSSVLGWSIRIIALLFLCIYTCASLALGTKASNLTNRGIVTKFPYNIVRHPAYISKNIFWLLTTLPIIIVKVNIFTSDGGYVIVRSFFIILAYMATATIYYFRAITEECHLMQDPDYQEYVKKVPWRFIPYVF